jgi:O-antigen/teichoic acid export membrane protein
MKRFSKNIIAITGSDMARRLLGFLTITYLTRHLSVDQFGIINIGFTILTYAILASSFGLSGYGARSIARGQSGDIVNPIISIRIIASIVVLVIIAILSPLLLKDRVTNLVVIIMSVSVIPYALLLDWFFQGKERMGVIGIARLSSAIVYFLIIVFFVRSSADIIWVAFSSLASDSISTILTWIIFRKEFRNIKVRYTLNGVKEIVKSSFPIGIGSILGSVTVNLPPLAIGIFLSNYHVGIYSAAGKFVFFLLMFDRILSTIFLPASSRILIDSPDSLVRMIKQARKWIVIISLPICVGGTLLADQIMIAVFGIVYLPSANIFRVLIWFFFATILHTIYSSGMIASGNEKIYGKVMAAGSALYVILIVAGTIIFGVIGSALGMVLAEFATLLMMIIQFNKFVKIDGIESLHKIILSVIIMGVVVAIFPQAHFSILVVLGGVVYAGLLFILNAIKIDDVRDLISRFV